LATVLLEEESPFLRVTPLETVPLRLVAERDALPKCLPADFLFVLLADFFVKADIQNFESADAQLE
jgi:hypothetical protein